VLKKKKKNKSTQHTRTRTNLAKAPNNRQPPPILALDERQGRHRPVFGLAVLEDAVDSEGGRAEAVVVDAGACVVWWCLFVGVDVDLVGSSSLGVVVLLVGVD
jgi:hypothetical protein